MRPGRPTIVLTGGGSGGHIYPALALVEGLRASFDVVYIGASRGMEATVVPKEGVFFLGIPAGGVLRKGLMGQVRGLSLTALGTVSAISWLLRLRPKAVVGTGGYVAGPVGLAAKTLGVPIFVIEPNAKLGFTNTLLARWAKAVYLGFPDMVRELPPSLRMKAVGVGIPVRSSIGTTTKEEARRQLGLDPRKETVLVFGGSLGARSLNEASEKLLTEGAGTAYQLIWATGRRYAGDYSGQAPAGVLRVPYIDDVPTALAASDVAVTRSGAITVAELSASCLPAVLVPSPYVSDDHQIRNAEQAKLAGGAVVLTEEEILAGRLGPVLLDLLEHPARLKGMADGMGTVVPRNAASEIVRHLVATLQGSGGKP